MGHPQAQVRFGALDKTMTSSARAAVEASPGQPVHLEVAPSLAAILKEFISVLADSGGVAFGPLNAELSPEQAGKILGVSRSLVVRRMEDGRLPFHYVGAHRRCRLQDVLNLKAAEAKQNNALAEIYDGLMDLDDKSFSPAPSPLCHDLGLSSGTAEGYIVGMNTQSHSQTRQSGQRLDPAVEIAATRLAEATDAEAVVLFGSRARGDFNDDSDWDLCVILPDDVELGRFTPVTLWPLVSDLGIPIQVVPIRRSVFEQKKSDVSALSHDIARDGVVIHGRLGQAPAL